MLRDPVVIGWREWLVLPELGIAAIKAKIDTGARTSSLHVEALETHEIEGATWLRFSVTPRVRGPRVQCDVPAVARRFVSDSSGRRTLRWVIRTRIELGEQNFDTEINLTDRRTMLFPMLLGRSALERRFHLDPSASYRCGRPPSKKIIGTASVAFPASEINRRSS